MTGPGPPPRRLMGLMTGRVLPVAAGMAVSAGSAYLFLVIAARALGPARYAPLAAFWSLVMIVGPGTFSALERDVARRLAPGLADGRPTPVLRYGYVIGGLLVIFLVVATAVGESTLRHTFNGDVTLLVALVVSFPAYCSEYLMLGQAIGNDDMVSYGLIIGSEGFTRLCIGALLIVVGMADAGALGAAVTSGTVGACVLAAFLLRQRARSASGTSFRSMAVTCAWQLVSILLLNILTNSGPLLVKLLAGNGQDRLAAPFLSALVVVRIPLLVWTSAGPSLLGRMGLLQRDGRSGELQGFVRRLCLLIAAIGAGSIAVSWVAGPFALRTAFGPGFVLPGHDMAVLSCLVTALILAATLSLVLTTIGKEHVMALCLALGVATMAAVIAAVPDLILRVELGLLVGSTVAAAAMFAVARRILWTSHVAIGPASDAVAHFSVDAPGRGL